MSIYEECGLVWLHFGCDQFAHSSQLHLLLRVPAPGLLQEGHGVVLAVAAQLSLLLLLAELRLVGNRLRALDAAQGLARTTCPFCNPQPQPLTTPARNHQLLGPRHGFVCKVQALAALDDEA